MNYPILLVLTLLLFSVMNLVDQNSLMVYCYSRYRSRWYGNTYHVQHKPKHRQTFRYRWI